jgi:tetratricopeptide (TPR) repeat protein
MPTRPPQHQLEDLSRTAFEALVKKWNWVFRSKQPDYGIDGEVEVFDKGRKATGDLFLVQLKAVEKLEGAPRISLLLEWIEYYKSLELPVLLGLWARRTNKFYWTWAGEIDRFYAKPKAKSMTVHLAYEWGPGTREAIERQIALRKALDSHHLPQPLKVSVAAPSHPAVVQKIKALLGHAPRALVLQDSHSHVVCTLSGDRLTIRFSGSTGVVFHSMKKTDDDGIAKRVALGIVLAAANFRALDQAAEMWRSLPNLSDAIRDTDVTMHVVSFLTRAGDIASLRSLIADLSPRLGKGLVTAPLYSLYWTAPSHRKAEILALLVELQEQDLTDPTPEARSIAHYNLARLSDDNPRKSVSYFTRAIRESSFYSDKAYFWKEFGSTLFSSHRYDAALKCYRCAYERLGHSERRSHFADALMHTGRYEEALKMFRNIYTSWPKATGEPEQDADNALDASDAVIKGTFLAEVVEKHGLTTQKRNSKLAEEVLGGIERGGNAEMIARTNDAIRQDALCSRAWFNRAIAMRREKKHDAAFLSFLAAAATCTGDDEAWANALFSSMDHAKEHFPYIVNFVQHHRGERFILFLVQQSEREKDKRLAAALLEMARIMGEQLPKGTGKQTMRVHHGKGPPLILERRRDE